MTESPPTAFPSTSPLAEHLSGQSQVPNYRSLLPSPPTSTPSISITAWKASRITTRPPGNRSDQYRPNQDVDIATTTDAGSGYEVINTASGEWLRYTVNAAAAGIYTLSAACKALPRRSNSHFELDGVAVSSSITIPPSASRQTITKRPTLTAGTHVLRLVFDANNSGGTAGNWNWFGFALNTAISPPAPLRQIRRTADRRSQINLSWSDVANETGFKVECSADGSTGWVQIATTTRADHLQRHHRRRYHPLLLSRPRHKHRRRSGYSNIAMRRLARTRTTSTLMPAGATWKYLDTGTNQGTVLGPPAASTIPPGNPDRRRSETVMATKQPSSATAQTPATNTSRLISAPASPSAIPLRSPRSILSPLRDHGAVVYLNGV